MSTEGVGPDGLNLSQVKGSRVVISPFYDSKGYIISFSQIYMCFSEQSAYRLLLFYHPAIYEFEGQNCECVRNNSYGVFAPTHFILKEKTMSQKLLLPIVQTINSYLSDYILFYADPQSDSFILSKPFVQVRCFKEECPVFRNTDTQRKKTRLRYDLFRGSFRTAITASRSEPEYRRRASARSLPVVRRYFPGCGSSRSLAWRPSMPRQRLRRKPVSYKRTGTNQRWSGLLYHNGI